MTRPYYEAINIIRMIWSERWTGHDTIPVLWHMNTSDITPSRTDTDLWLHNSIEFDDEAAIAFGGGPFNIERELRGIVCVRVFAGRGLGEVDSLMLLDDALAVFRSVRIADLSFIGDMVLPQPGASDDGGWWIRQAIASFTRRFRG